MMCGREVLSPEWIPDFKRDRKEAMRLLWQMPQYRKKTLAGLKKKQRGPDKKKRKCALRIGPEEITKAVESAKRLKEKVDRMVQESRYGITRKAAA